LTARRADAEADAGGVVVTARDFGGGVAPEDVGRVFEKFYRSHAGRRQASGAGLGLAICKGIVDVHGGRSWAENCPDGGIAFSFTLVQTAPMPVVSSEP